MPPNKISAIVEDDTVYLRLPYELKERAKSLPAYRWDKKRRVWTFPATAAVAGNIIDEFSYVERDKEFIELENLFLARRVAHKYLNFKKGSLKEPEIVKGSSWHHQLQAYNFIASLWGGISNGAPRGGALLAYDMGTGKSRVAIQLIENFALKKVLILCPKSVMDVWPEQIERHARYDLSYLPIVLNNESVKRRAEMMKHFRDRSRLFVLNYDAAWRGDMRKAILEINWDLVILDEAHRIKSPNSAISKFCAELGSRIPARLAMTGTPLPHSPLDAFALYRFLDPGIFGLSHYRFKEEYAVLGGFEQKQVVAFRNLDELHDKMYSIAIRVTKEECLDLPELIHERLTCSLKEKTRKIYDKIENDFYAELEGGEVTAANILVKILRLQQITSGHVTDDEGKQLWIDDSKEKLLEDFLQDLPKDEPVVVFCRFRNDLDAVHRVVNRICYVPIGRFTDLYDQIIPVARMHRGSLELSGRVNQLKAWQEGEGHILAVQIQSGGVGIDLTRAAYAIYYSVGYSLADYLQSVSRLHRPGQKRKVSCYHLVASNTIDEKVYKALEKREEVIESVLGVIEPPALQALRRPGCPEKNESQLQDKK